MLRIFILFNCFLINENVVENYSFFSNNIAIVIGKSIVDVKHGIIKEKLWKRERGERDRERAEKK